MMFRYCWLLSTNIWRLTYSLSRFETTAHLWHFMISFALFINLLTYLLTYWKWTTFGLMCQQKHAAAPRGQTSRRSSDQWLRYVGRENCTCKPAWIRHLTAWSTPQTTWDERQREWLPWTWGLRRVRELQCQQTTMTDRQWSMTVISNGQCSRLTISGNSLEH